MSDPNSNALHYVAYSPNNPWTYDYLQFPAYVDPSMAFDDCVHRDTQPLPTVDNFFPTMAPEFYPNGNRVQTMETGDHGASAEELYSNAKSDRQHSYNAKTDVNDSIYRIIDAIEDLAAITRELCVTTGDNSRAIRDISTSVESLSKRMDRIKNTVEQLACTIGEVLECERAALEKFGNLSGRLERRSVSTGINIERRPSE